MKNKILILILSLFVFANNAQRVVPLGKGTSPLSTNPSAGNAGNQQQKTKNTFTVVVGISDYQDPAIPDLRFADKDAEAFANYLRSNAGGKLDNDHLKVLINQQATMAQFANALDWLIENAKEGDQAIIYFSGHGDVEKKTLTQPGFLLCWDAPARVYMAGGAFALPMLQEVISTLSVQNKTKVIVITDACRSGTLAGSSVGGSQATASNLAKQFANEIKIMSCQPNEYSIEGEQWGGGRGAFSFHLIDALYGMADANDDQSVTLYEVGRYLEDHVTKEVAPISQLPMVLGNRNEQLTKVDASLLASLKAGKTNQMAMLSSVESKGMEENVLLKVDTTIRELYRLFNKSLRDKSFFSAPVGEPKDACAETYYSKLMQVPSLKPLHSTIRRNYAAALQDGAQQIISIWLNSDPKLLSCIGNSIRLEVIPLQLKRSAELLGENHYMYKAIKGRQYLFEGIADYMVNLFDPDSIKGRRCIDLFNRSLVYEPNSALTYFSLMNVYGKKMLNLDSAKYFMEKAVQLSPNWVLPLVSFYWLTFNKQGLASSELRKITLDRALAIDSTHGMVLSSYSYWLMMQSRFDEAIEVFQKYLKNGGVTYHCWYSQLFSILLTMNLPGTSEKLIQKLITIDTSSSEAMYTLFMYYQGIRDYPKAKSIMEKILPQNPNNSDYHYSYGRLLIFDGHLEEAIPHFEFVINKKDLNMGYNFHEGESCMGEVLLKLGRKKEANVWFHKVITDSPNLNLVSDFYLTGRAYWYLGRMDSMQSIINKAILDKPNNPDYEYSIAALYSMAEMEKESLYWMEKFFIDVKPGPRWYAEIDFDMHFITGTPGFKALKRKYFPDKK